MTRRLIVALPFSIALVVASAASAAEYPLAKSKLRVSYATAGKQTLKVSGRWQGSLAGSPPTLDGATLRVAGGYGEGGTSVIGLAASAWSALGNDRGYKYTDPSGAAGGIRKIVLKNGRNGGTGTLTIVGGKTNLDYDHRAAHTELRMSLEIGLDRWCAAADAVLDVNGRINGSGIAGPSSCPGNPIVSPAWLAARLGDPDLQVIDARASFGGLHVPGALPLRPEDLADLSGPFAPELLTPALAEPVLEGIGLRRDATVVVYGRAPEYEPARVVWSLYQFGHPDVRYLDGGWNGWLASGGATAAGDPVAGPATTYTIDAERDALVTGPEILAQLGSPPYSSPESQLVDARMIGEYTTGHIPTAVFIPWQSNLTSGFLHPRAQLEDGYTALGLDPTEPTVAYCLVGWRASLTWLVLAWLGFDEVRVYDASWTEWGAGGYPIETGS